jgi:hypothetical protein
LAGRGFLDGNEVVRAFGVVAFLHRGADFVVRLSEDVVELDAVGVVTVGVKRLNVCHVGLVDGNGVA